MRVRVRLTLALTLQAFGGQLPLNEDTHRRVKKTHVATPAHFPKHVHGVSVCMSVYVYVCVCVYVCGSGERGVRLKGFLSVDVWTDN